MIRARAEASLAAPKAAEARASAAPARQLVDGPLEIGIVARERQRISILMQRFAELTVPMMDFGDAAYRREIFRSASQYQLQLGERVIELIELDEGAPERDARGEIARVDRETGAAGVDSFLTLPGAPQFFGELRKCNRRRILLDPASKIVDALVVGHAAIRARLPL